MGRTQRVRAGWLVIAMGLCLVPAGRVQAQVNTERPGSLLIFPKVVNDGTRNTVIQISNTGNSLEQARCFYINGQLGGNGRPRCSETDFHLRLTKQQPTFWSVATGRTTGLPGPGIMSGPVPPVPFGFVGALVCASVDRGDTPSGTNSLVGKATLYGPGPNSTKYNAVSFINRTPSADNKIQLDGSEYSACPGAARVNFPNPIVPDPVIAANGSWGQCQLGGGACAGNADCTSIPSDVCLNGICSSTGARCQTGPASPFPCSIGVCSALTGSVTNVTVLPCNIDLDNNIPASLSLSLNGSDGEEIPLSGGKTLSCWESFTLDARPDCSGAGGYGHVCLTTPSTSFATVNITSTSGGPFVAVAETFHLDTAGNASSAGVNVYSAYGTCAAGDNYKAACNNDFDCVNGGAGSCVAPTGAVITLPAN